ncbi:hypothetical protein IT157_07565, partial [bacterium]|nr:hypothetical protein [bacterium]
MFFGFVGLACGGEPMRRGSAQFTYTAVGDTLFTLPQSWIEADSVVIRKNHAQLQPYLHYRIFEPGNRIWLFTPLGPGDTLAIDYAYRPYPLLRTYQRRSLRSLGRIGQSGDSAVAIIPTESLEASESSWTSLRKSGSLVRSIQIGTGQDAAFESALNLQVEGTVSKNVEVAAVLTDQNIPIQPEGTSESIRELDKVFVTVKSPKISATVGDYALKFSGGRYDNYERKLTGLLAAAKVGGLTSEISAAASRGEFHTLSLGGEEGVQGPYALSGKNGESSIVILAGTETLWLDGAVMRRGEGNDYVIDYSSGEITFTSKRLISSESRIVIDFQYANESYERQYLASRLSFAQGDSPFAMRVSYLSERDDRSLPLGLSYTDEDESVLRDAGDDRELAVSASADSIGPYGGDYTRRDTTIESTQHSIFVYVPPISSDSLGGEWRVFFDDFAQGFGDYAADADSLGRVFFRWVGVNQGRYLPSKRLDLATSSEIVDLGFDIRKQGKLHLSGEAAFSNFDANTFSKLDDADNQGAAGSMRAGWEANNAKVIGVAMRRISLDLEGRVRGEDFREIARSSEIEFDRDWGTSGGSLGEEWIGESRLAISPSKALTLSSGVGLLDRTDVSESQRWSAQLSYRDESKKEFAVSHLNIAGKDSAQSRSSDWIRQHANGTVPVWMLTPRFRVDREERKIDTRFGKSGFRFTDAAVGTGALLSETWRSDLEVGARRDDTRESDARFEKSSEAKSASGELQWTPAELGRGGVRFTHREKTYSDADSQGVTSDAGRLDLFLAPQHDLYELNLLYDALSSKTERQIQVFLPTDPGLGNYRLENGVYLPDDQGDYILVSRNTGEYEPSSEVRANATLWLRPDESRGKENFWWNHLAFETEATIEERTRLPMTAGLLLLNPSKLRGAETLEGKLSIREDVHVNRLSRRASFRLRVKSSSSVVTRFANGSQDRRDEEIGLRARLKFTATLRGETEATQSIERDVYEGVSISSQD